MKSYSAKNITVFRTARDGLTLWGGGDGREEPTSQLHTCLDWKAIEEIRNLLEWEGGSLGGDHQFGCCGFRGSGFDTPVFFFDFTVSGLLAAVDLSSGFLGLAVFLVAVTLGCSGDSVPGSGEGFGFGGVVVVTLTTHHPRAT